MAGELNDKQLQNLDATLKSMNNTLANMEGLINKAGAALSNAFGSTARAIVQSMQQELRGVRFSELMGIDDAKLNIQGLTNDIERLKKSLELGGPSTLQEIIGPRGGVTAKWVRERKYGDGEEMRDRDDLEKLRQKLADSYLSTEKRSQEAAKIVIEGIKQEEKNLVSLIERRNEYNRKIAESQQKVKTDRENNNGQLSQEGKFYQKQLNDYVRLSREANEQIRAERDKGTKLSIEEETRLRLAQREQLYRIQNRQTGSASPEWREMMRGSMDARNRLQKVADDYRKAEVKITDIIKRINDKQAKLGQQQQQGRAQSTITRTTNELKKLEADLEAARKKAEQLGAALNTLGGGNKRYTDIRRALGLPIDEVRKKVKSTKTELESLYPTLKRLAGAFGVAFSVKGLVQFGKKLIETRGEFELQQVAMRSILQNKQLADEIWDKTMQAALQSPFTAMQLTRYTKQLAAYRIETEKLFDTTKMLADVSAGLGVDMQRLILAYGQVKAANYLRASEIRQFTEAGVNILGELSQYFSKTRGQMYSTAQVMEMVQKRMVEFGDVEEIFKRMTREGGIFYDMQYVQSQTVKGQINKLHDAYDQMLNSIGKSNQGTIRDSVALLNRIVKNWREWKTVLDTSAWSLMIVGVGKFAKGLLAVGSSARLATGEIKGLEKAGTRLRNVIGKVNPWMVLATAVTAATFALINHSKAIKAVQKEIDEQNLRLYETNDQLRSYQQTLEANNRTITENAQKKNEEKLSEEELNEKREESRAILAKLKNDYPQLAEGMELMRDGTVKLTNALNLYVQEMERVMTVNNLMGQTSGTFLGGLFSDTVKTNMQEWETDLSQLKGELISMQSAATMGMMKLEQGGLTFNEIPLFNLLKQIKELDISDVEKAKDKYNQLLKQVVDVAGVEKIVGAQMSGALIKKTQLPDYLSQLTGLTEFKHDQPTITKDFREKVLPVLNSNFEWAVEQVGEYSEKITNEYGGNVLKFVAKNSKLINEGVTKGNADVVKVIRKSLNDAGVGLTKESREFYNKILNEQIRATQIQEALIDIPFANITERMEKMQEIARNYVPIDFFATPTGAGESSSTDEDKKSKIDAAWRRRISLLEEMKKRYDELSKSAYGYQKSEQEVRKAFGDFVNELGIMEKGSFSKIFEGTGITMDMIDFTSMEGMFKSMRLLLQQAKGISDAVREEIMKKIDSYEAQITISAQVRLREDFGRQMEEAFGNYELTLELQKLNVPDDFAKDIFPDFEQETLGSLQDRMNAFYEDQKKMSEDGKLTYLDEEDLKTYQQWAKKVEAEILKMRKERVKEYSKYLEKEYSERAKLEMQHAKDVAFVTANFADDAQRDNILKGLNDKFEKDLNELNWKSFKESSFYVEMMDDLSSIPMEYMKIMLGKIEEILQHPETLSPRALKEAINARQKIIEAQMDFDQVSVMRDSITEIREAAKSAEEGGVGGNNWRQTKQNLNEEQKLQAEKLAAIEKQIEANKTLQGQVKALEDAEIEAAQTTSAINQTALKEIEETYKNDFPAALEAYKTELNDTQQRVADFVQKQQKVGQKDKAGNEIKITQDEKDRNSADLARIDALEILIPLIDEYIKKQKALSSYLASTEGKAARTAKESGKTSTSIGKDIQDQQTAADKISSRLTLLKQWQKAFRNFDNAFVKFNKNAADMVNRLGALSSVAFDTWGALGGETNALTEEWKNFGNTVTSVIQEALTMIPGLVAGFTTAGTSINAAMGIIGLIAEAIQLVLTLINGIAKLHDAGVDRDIEKSKERVEELSYAYERLEKSIEKTLKTASYMSDYNKQVANIRQQIAEAEIQMNVAQGYKDEDKKREALNAARDSRDQALAMLDEIQQKQLETFGGIGPDNYPSWAQDFVSAWKDAFLETGDGLDALNEHFDEFLQEWFVKQATMRVAGSFLEPYMKEIDAAVANGNVDYNKLHTLVNNLRDSFPELNEILKQMIGEFDLSDVGSLSGLAAGIQGMTEEQANILESYWNSVRMYTANIDMNVARIANALGLGENSPNTNPMLNNIATIAQRATDIHNLLRAVSVNNGQGIGFRVYQG